MFYTLILENETGQQIDLSKTANRFMFSKIEGLNPPAGTISTSSYAGMDGSYLNNAFIQELPEHFTSFFPIMMNLFLLVNTTRRTL